VAGDFNVGRDHRPFRDLLAVGFRDCADASQPFGETKALARMDLAAGRRSSTRRSDTLA